jgi:lysophospholipase L1-like esterase
VRSSRIRVISALAVATVAIGLSVAATPAKATTSLNHTASIAKAVRYVALGDSYASGVGSDDYFSASGSCQRSHYGYPQLWADAHKPASFAFVACSGATVADVIHSQLPAVKKSTTLVSVTIGGNDANFTNILGTCILDSTGSCLSAVAQGEAFVEEQLPKRLDTMLADIRKAAPSAKVVVIGYPEFYDTSVSSCQDTLSSQDRAALDQGAAELDKVLATAAAHNRDVFADVRSRFAGHQLCDAGSWIRGLTSPLTDSYHPSVDGQQYAYLPAFAAAVIEKPTSHAPRHCLARDGGHWRTRSRWSFGR